MKTNTDFLTIAFARGEIVAKRVDYLKSGTGKSQKRAALILTNMRLIHATYEKKGHEASSSMDEIPLSAIDSLDYGYLKVKNPLSPFVFVAAAILLIGGIATFFLNDIAPEYVRYIGIGAIALAPIIVLLSFFLRKAIKGFYFNVFSHSLSHDHLSFNTAKPTQEQLRGSAKTKRMVLTILLIVSLLGFGAGIAFSIIPVIPVIADDPTGIASWWQSLILPGSLLLGWIVVTAVLSSLLKRGNKVKNAAIEPRPSKKKNSGALISTYDYDGLLDFFNACGSMIENFKSAAE